MNKFEAATNLIWAVALTTMVSVVAGSLAYHYTTVKVEAMKNGYEPGVVPGVDGVHWVKRREAEKP